MAKVIKKEIEFGGRILSLEYGELAGQANGSVLARYGDTVVLATATSDKAKEDLGYFPLSVEYVERLYAGGIIKGSRFVKREGRPSDEAVISGRLIDRSIRPLFPKDYLDEVQVVITVLSVDRENDPAVLGVIGASAALACSDIPWEGPIGAVRLGRVAADGKVPELRLNPVAGEIAVSDLDLIVSGKTDEIVMVEGGASEVSEEEILKAIEFAQGHISPVTKLISDLAEEIGIAKREVEVDPQVRHMMEDLRGFALAPLKGIVEEATNKEEFNERLAELSEKVFKEFEGTYQKVGMATGLGELKKEAVRELLIKDGKRTDGRKFDEVRPLHIRVGVLPRTHGSAIFQRGETQVLTTATLGSTSLEQILEGPEGETTKRFMHHYYFPPFSVGEVGRMIGPGRREIGHSALAERALARVIPPMEQFPYTIRLVSEVLSSNGSTSMASTCGSTLALMDAGVPIKSPVSGVAMGLVTDGKVFRILTDIAGVEDECGDMDFKVAGTEKGVTAVQMDMKVKGLPHEVMAEALAEARKARLGILKEMLEVLDKPREKLSQYAPKVATIKVPIEKIGEVIGPGGRMIRRITEQTGTEIDVDDDGTVNISGPDEQKVQEARKMVDDLTREVQVGEIFEGTVQRIMDFGAFVEILPGKEGMVHVSELSSNFVAKPTDVVNVGDKIKVKVIEIDPMGRINLSKKALEGSSRGYPERPRDNHGRPSGRRPFRPGGFGGGRLPRRPGFGQPKSREPYRSRYDRSRH
uniref:Polyribonucleotide nucleotidyltransferase n=1 Tax=candidate division WWE3 bacterium TaxID=2053526 RepID=A0A831YYS9_UNCKA